MKIGISNDHAATEMKFFVKEYLESLGHEVVNYGTDTTERYDYPIAGETLARAVVSGEVECGVAICGTGIGISLAANKVHGIRAAVCSEPVSARLAKEHNDANIICFGARIVGNEMAKAILDAYLNAKHQGGRHSQRVAMVMAIEEK